MNALQTELVSDPLGLGYAPLVAAKDDAGIAFILNAVRGDIQIDQLVPRWMVKAVLYSSGELAGIVEGSSKEAKHAALMMSDGDFQNFDFVRFPAVVATLQSLVEQGLMVQESFDMIMYMGKRSGSRAEHLGLGTVSQSDVARAVRDDFGNPLIGA